MPSEIEQLIQRIDAETLAMCRGLSGLSETAKHTFISHKYAAIGAATEQLADLIGDDAYTLANGIVDAAMVLATAEQAMKGASHVG